MRCASVDESMLSALALPPGSMLRKPGMGRQNGEEEGSHSKIRQSCKLHLHRAVRSCRQGIPVFLYPAAWRWINVIQGGGRTRFMAGSTPPRSFTEEMELMAHVQLIYVSLVVE